MPQIRYIFTLFMVSVLMLAAGCRRVPHDQRLLRAGSLASDHPEEALACLDSINIADLSASDRHFYDFLTVKTSDKAFIRHTSDSLILSVIDYAEARRLDPAHRAETLYYGGRVYSDLGDYPTALSYFQQALDLLPDEPTTLPLRGVILSQTAQLMRKIGLYAKSIPYTEKSLELRRQGSDTKGEYYSLSALGYIYYKLKKYQESEQFYNKAFDLSRKLSPETRAEAKADLAEIKYRLGQTASALMLIRHLADSVKRPSRYNVLGTAAHVYCAAGILDTAYIYARELAYSDRPLNRNIGFSILLSPELRKFSPVDSLLKYISLYSEVMNQTMATNGIAPC